MNGKRYLAWALLLLTLLSGCTILPGKLEEFGQDVFVSLPDAVNDAPEAPFGDAKTGEVLNAVLYYPSADGLTLMPVNRTLWLTGSRSAEERIAQELLKAPSGEGLLPAAPENMTLEWANSASGALTLSFSLSGEMPGDEALVRFLSALGETFSGDGGRPVNALINGRAVSVYGFPAGAVSAADADSALWIRPGEDDGTLLRNVVVYCPSADGLYVVPETRRVAFDANAIPACLLNEMTKAPNSKGLLPAIPLSEGGIEREPTIETTEDLQKIASFHFTMDLFNALEASAEEREQFLAALVLTFSDFVKDFDGMRVYIAGHLVTEVPLNNGDTLRFDDGIIRRSDFSARVGDLVTLYFADGDGNLLPEPRAAALADRDSLRLLTDMLMEGAREAGHVSAFPEGLTDADLLGAAVRDHVALLNFSPALLSLTETLDEAGERALVYSLVNTLAGLDRVRAVRIYVDGETVDTLSGGICLRGVLLPNPGLCARAESQNMEWEGVS